MSNEPDLDGIRHYTKALELGKAKGPVSIEEAQEILAAMDAHDPVCPTMDHIRRVLNTLVDVLKDGPTLEGRSEAARKRLREEYESRLKDEIERVKLAWADDVGATRQRIAALEEALKHALSYCYEPADQTVSCSECRVAWWDQDEEINQNWHAEGCKLFAANVLVGLSKNEKDKDHPNTEPPHPDPRKPAQILRDTVLASWFQKLAYICYGETPPEGFDKSAWQQVLITVIDRLHRKMKQ